jgi:uncharacterized membrane protein YgcG
MTRFYFTLNLLLDDHVPAMPDASFARTRNHILVVGRAPVAYCDAVVVWFTTNGAANVCELSIWIEYVAAPATSVQSKVIVVPGANLASAAGLWSDGAGSGPVGGGEGGGGGSGGGCGEGGGVAPVATLATKASPQKINVSPLKTRSNAPAVVGKSAEYV